MLIRKLGTYCICDHHFLQFVLFLLGAEIKCDKINIPNKKKSVNCTKGKKFNSKCKISCNSGYSLKGHGEVKCIFNGTIKKGVWSPDLPSCEGLWRLKSLQKLIFFCSLLALWSWAGACSYLRSVLREMLILWVELAAAFLCYLTFFLGSEDVVNACSIGLEITKLTFLAGLWRKLWVRRTFMKKLWVDKFEISFSSQRADAIDF